MTTEQLWKARRAAEEEITHLLSRRFGRPDKEVFDFQQFEGGAALVAAKKRDREYVSFITSLVLQKVERTIEEQLQTTERRMGTMLAALENKLFARISDEFEAA